MKRRTVIALLVAPLVSVATLLPATADDAGTSPVQASAPSGAEVDAPVPEIKWNDCDDGLQCATVHVPLDYDEPHRATTELSLKKHPARNGDADAGALFVNPGGPGDSAVDELAWFVENLPEGAVDRFDVIGVDPRGVGGSSSLTCRAHGESPDPPQTAFPITRPEIETTLRYDRHVRRSCATEASPIIDHMTTADTARDMDLIRQAVGDEQLTYYGISYGSVLGSTYAAMFPDRLRAMVVDGVMDPIAYTTGHRKSDARRPTTSRWGSDMGSWQTLTAAFAECDRVGPQRCPIAGEAAATWQRVMDRLERGPATVDGEQLHHQDVVARASGALTGVDSYHALMRYIDATHDLLFESESGHEPANTRTYARLRDQLADPHPEQAPQEVQAPATEGVVCADSLNPDDPRDWIDAGARADHQAPWFGRLWTWRSSLCADWPGSPADAYAGPFATDTSAPVLLIAHLHDPSTPISGARTLNGLLEGSRLLILDGWGHGALGESICIGRHVEHYLVSSDLPAPGTVCQQDQHPFPRR